MPLREFLDWGGKTHPEVGGIILWVPDRLRRKGAGYIHLALSAS